MHGQQDEKQQPGPKAESPPPPDGVNVDRPGQRGQQPGLPRTPLHISDDPSSDGLFSPAVALQHVVQQRPLTAAAAAAASASAADGGDAGNNDGGGEGGDKNEGTSEAADETAGAGAGAGAAAAAAAAAGGKPRGQRKWLCDACRVANFSSYEEACRHEETCTGQFADAAADPLSAVADADTVDADAPVNADLPAVDTLDAAASTTGVAAAAAPASVPGASVGMAGMHVHAATAPGLAPGPHVHAATGMEAVAAGAALPPLPPPGMGIGMAAYAPSSGYPPAIPVSMNVTTTAAAVAPPMAMATNMFPAMAATAAATTGAAAGAGSVSVSAPLPEQQQWADADPATAAYLHHQQAILRSQETGALVGHHHALLPPPFMGHPPPYPAVPNGGLGVASAGLYPVAALPPPPPPQLPLPPAAANTGGNDYVAVVKPTPPPPPLPQPLGAAAAVEAAAGSGAATAVPETVPMVGHNIVEVYVCDVCRVAQFDSYDEACRHEEECDGGAPGAGSGSNIAEGDNSFADADADVSADAGVAASESLGPGIASANDASGGVGTDTSVSEAIAEAKEEGDDGVAACLERPISTKPASPANQDVGIESSDEKDLAKPKEAAAAPSARPDNGTTGTKRKLPVDQTDVRVAKTPAPAAEKALTSDETTPQLQPDRSLSELPRRKKPRPPTKYQCGSCDFCMVDSCGTCKACLDMPRFGGSGALKRKCHFRPTCPNRPTPKRSPTNHEPALVSKEIATGAPTTANTAAIADGDNEGPSNDSDQLWTFVAIDGHRFERMRGYKKRIPQVLVVWKGGEKTWEPAKNVKEDDPVTFFRYVDKIGLEEQSEEDSKSKLGGKTAWRKILKDGRPPMIEG